jgi:transcriptional regulator with XRE-family HTH domain
MLSVLAAAKGVKQTALAKSCNLSRVSINRFFRGKSFIGGRELVQILHALGIDLGGEVSSRLQRHIEDLGGRESNTALGSRV